MIVEPLNKKIATNKFTKEQDELKCNHLTLVNNITKHTYIIQGANVTENIYG